MVGKGHSEIFGVIYQFLPYRTKGAIVNGINSEVSEPNVTKLYTM